MAGEWIDCKLADACSSIDYGLTASASDQELGPKFLRITDIVSGHIDWKRVPHVVVGKETSAKYRLHDADIVLARTGASTGASAYVKNPPPAVFASYLVRLQAKPEFDPQFLAYYLKGDQFWAFIRGVLGDKSAQPNASAATMTAAPLHAPREKDEQRGISRILGSLDDKIDLNHRMNETLEAMARAIFESWFVNFDPVRAKASGEAPDSTCRRLGLTPNLLALFPDGLVDSELGEIPEGWAAGRIADHCYLNVHSWTEETLPAAIHYVDLANAKNGVVSHVQVFSSSTAPSRARRALRAGDTIVGTVRPGNRSFALIGERSLQLTGSTGFAVLTPRRAELRELVYLLATAEENIARLSHLADGAAYPAVRPEVVTAGPCVVAPGVVIDAFHEVVSAMIDRQIANQANDAALASVLDSLLPKLLSGELRVPREGAA